MTRLPLNVLHNVRGRLWKTRKITKTVYTENIFISSLRDGVKTVSRGCETDSSFKDKECKKDCQRDEKETFCCCDTEDK